jgi:hypothetical protein
MTHDPHSSPPPQVPAEMVAQHRAGWHAFTRMMLWNGIATAAVLVFLLLVAKVF